MIFDIAYLQQIIKMLQDLEQLPLSLNKIQNAAATVSNTQSESSDSAQASSDLDRFWQEFTKSGQASSPDSKDDKTAPKRFQQELRSNFAELLQPR